MILLVDKSLPPPSLSNWRRTSDSSSDSSSSASAASSTSTPTAASNHCNIEALTKQVAALEVELKERTEKLETATERLSDRELEISILQKRLELRSKSNGHNKSEDLSKCSGCVRKDGLISCLFEKVNLYESAILNPPEAVGLLYLSGLRNGTIDAITCTHGKFLVRHPFT